MNTHKDISFLQEIKSHLDNGRTDTIRQMINDWLDELRGNGESETWKFVVGNTRGKEAGYSKIFTKTLTADDDLGSPYEQAELIAYGLQRKHPKCNVNANCNDANSMIALPTWNDVIKDKVFKAKQREKPIDLESIDKNAVEYRIRRAFNYRYEVTPEMKDQIYDLSRRVLESDVGKGSFMHEVDGTEYYIEYYHAGGGWEPDSDWFNIIIKPKDE